MSFLTRFPKAMRQKVKQKLRNKAIARAETRILLNGRKVEDFSESELEIIVKEEEDKLIANIKEKSVLAILAMLGLSVLG